MPCEGFILDKITVNVASQSVLICGVLSSQKIQNRDQKLFLGSLSYDCMCYFLLHVFISIQYIYWIKLCGARIWALEIKMFFFMHSTQTLKYFAKHSKYLLYSAVTVLSVRFQYFPSAISKEEISISIYYVAYVEKKYIHLI